MTKFNQRHIEPLTEEEAKALLIPAYEDFLTHYIPENLKYLPTHLQTLTAEEIMEKFIFPFTDVFAFTKTLSHIKHNHETGADEIVESWKDLFHLIARETFL